MNLLLKLVLYYSPPFVKNNTSNKIKCKEQQKCTPKKDVEILRQKYYTLLVLQNGKKKTVEHEMKKC